MMIMPRTPTTPDMLTLNPWRDLTLSTRAKTMLEHHQLTTIRELIRYKPSRLEKLQGCGKVTVLEIRTALSKYGLDLKPEPPDEG